MSRGRRVLGPEETELWHLVARYVTPLAGRTLPPVELPAKPASNGPAPPASPPSPARPVKVPSLRAPKPGVVALDRKTTRALARGRREVDASVDLHGLTEAEAHAALHRFLVSAQGRGCRLVQIVTGKGEAGGSRGVLRRNVPHWLAHPSLRSVVLGFQEAAPHRGGAGALYVRLRRRA